MKAYELIVPQHYAPKNLHCVRTIATLNQRLFHRSIWPIVSSVLFFDVALRENLKCQL